MAFGLLGLAGIGTALAIISNSPLIIGLVVGAVVGAALLVRLSWIIWILLVGILLVNGPLVFLFPTLNKGAWLLSMLGFLVGFGGLLRYNARPGKPPLFISLALLFVIYATIVSTLSGGLIVEQIAGTKRYFQLWGVMFALALAPFSAAQVRKWLVFVIAVALVQLPFAIAQRVYVVPMRIGLGQGIVPIDAVAGTLEVDPTGGGANSVMAMLLLIVSTYLLAAMRFGAISKMYGIAALVVCAVPLALGETKVVLLLIPVVFAVVFGDLVIRRPLAGLAGITSAAFLVFALGWLYFIILPDNPLSPIVRIERAIEYNFGESGYYDRWGLNRTSVLRFWWRQHGLANPEKLLFGYGLGASYSGAGSLVPGHIDNVFPQMAIGLTTGSSILWDLGLVGALIFASILFAALAAAFRLFRSSTHPHEAAISAALLVAVSFIFIGVFYSNALISILSMQMIFSGCIGVLAWQTRSTATRSDSSGISGQAAR